MYMYICIYYIMYMLYLTYNVYVEVKWVAQLCPTLCNPMDLIALQYFTIKIFKNKILLVIKKETFNLFQ